VIKAYVTQKPTRYFGNNLLNFTHKSIKHKSMRTKHTISSFLLSLVILLSVAACNHEEKKDVLLFSAEIKNPTGDSIFIENLSKGEVVIAFRLNNGILSKDSVALPMGYYRISDGNETTLCFLKPGFDLHLSLNTKEFDESIKYSGIGGYENNYLAAKYLLEESFQDVNNYGYYASLEETEFLLFADSIYNLKLELFNKNKSNFDKDFGKLEFENLKIQYLTKLANYESMHSFITENQAFKVSNDFPNPFININLDDEQLLLVSGYINFIKMYLQQETIAELDKTNSTSYYNTLIDLLDSKIKNTKIKEEIAYYIGPASFSYAEDKEYFYGKLKEIISNPEYLNQIEEIYSKIKKTKKGAISPTFELYDIDSNFVKLENFKGKLVYIDIWATWCSPCIKEIPYLDKLQTEFKDKNIVFISICQNDVKEIWEAVVLSNELQGIHIFIPEIDNKFLSDYLVTGIPRFILIDEKGFIIDSEALRPSNPALKEQLDELLNCLTIP